MPDEVGSLEASALKRKERLAALREAKSKKKSDGDKKLPTFRSYKPADESLKELALPEVKNPSNHIFLNILILMMGFDKFLLNKT